MNSIKEVYENLKKYDSKKQIIISKDNSTIELKQNDDKIIAWEDYLMIESKGKGITHWHPDYDEIYLYFIKVLKKIETIPTKKEIQKEELKNCIIYIILSILSIIFCGLIGIENNLIMTIITIGLIIIFYLLINTINKTQNKKKEDYPLDCKEPSKKEKEIERIYNCDKRRIISIYKKRKTYTYEILVKSYDDCSNSFYWNPINTIGVSIFDTLEKARKEALTLFPLKEKINIKKDNVISAYQFCTNNKPALAKDKLCGCFYCLKIFTSDKIKIWLRDTKGTAICPFCGINSVIGENSGYSITKEFLKKMRQYWFK